MKILLSKISFVFLFIMVMLFTSSTVFAEEDSLQIKMTVGDSLMKVNGDTISIEKPYIKNDSVMIPLQAVLRVLGAEVNLLENHKMNIIYQDVSVDLTADIDKYISNQVEKQLSAAPFEKNGEFMIPLQFVSDNFEVTANYNQNKSEISIIQEDDGALSDLSFLVGGISKEKVGNSFFNWSISVPKSSRIVTTTFNSKSVSIANEHRNINLEISVESNNAKTILTYYKDRKDKFENEELFDSSINLKSNPPYCEFLYSSRYEDSSYERVYISKDFIYRVVLSSAIEVDPQKLRSNEYYMSVMDSFSLGYKGNAKDTQDISKVKFGFANYENYTSFDDSSNKYLTWTMDFSPEWDVVSTNSSDPLMSRIGLNTKEYIDVKIDKPDKKGTLEEYVSKAKKLYDENFNKKYYTFIEKKNTEIAGFKAINLLFTIKLGSNKYMIDESFIKIDNLIYDITLKSPQDKYKKKKDAYYKILGTLKIPKIENMTAFEKDIDSNVGQENKKLVSKDGNVSSINNKKTMWSLKIGGNWSTEKDFEGTQMFVNTISNMLLIIVPVENTAKNKGIPDEEKFDFIKSMMGSDKMKLIKKETVNDKKTTIRLYTYRVEDEDAETYGDLKLYVMDRNKYSYCFATLIPDLTSSEKNLKEIRNIWASFTVGK